MKKWIVFIGCISLLFVSCLGGCKSKNENGFYLYYMTADKTGLYPVEYEPSQTEGMEGVKECLEQLSKATATVDYMNPISAQVEIRDCQLDQGALSIYFDRNYLSITGTDEVLMRAAIVKTVLQISQVDYVTFYVGDKPLTDANGVAIGAMDYHSFVADFGQESESLLSTSLVLYFSSADGKSLVKEERVVYYSSNVSLDKLVMEELLKGPDTENGIRAIPQNAKLLSTSVIDGVCYVNLDQGFLSQTAGVNDEVIIYSIVNSLTALDNIAKVQIMVNGDTNIMYHDTFDLRKVYETGTVTVIQMDSSSTTEEIIIE